MYELFYYYLGITILFLSICFKSRTHLYNLTHAVKYRYQRLKSLNNFVSSRYKNRWKIIKISFSIIFKIFYISICQSLNKCIETKDNGQYVITYVIRGRLYKMIIDSPKGPKKFIQIIDNDDEDITDILEPYIGPNSDFHNKKTTPADFKYKNLTFNMTDGSTLFFEKNDIIKLNNKND